MTTVLPPAAEGSTPAAEPTPATEPSTPITVALKPCGCGVLAGEACDCAEFLAGLDAAPVFYLGGSW